MTNKYSDVTEHINLQVGGMQTSIFSILGPHQFKFYMNREKAKECRGATALQRTRLNGFWLTGGGGGNLHRQSLFDEQRPPFDSRPFSGTYLTFQNSLGGSLGMGR